MNWKYILIIVILAAIVGGGILWLATKQEAFQLPEIKQPQNTNQYAADHLKVAPEDETAELKIAFVHQTVYESNKPFQTSIRTINSDGSQEKILVNLGNKVISARSLSTNGKYLGWLTPDRLVQGITSFSMEYVSMNQRTKVNRIIAPNGTIEDFTWSPDGKKIAVLETGIQANRSVTNFFAIRIFDLEQNVLIGEFQGISNRLEDRLDGPSLPFGITWSKSADRLIAVYRSGGEYKIASYSTNRPISEKIIYSLKSERGLPSLTVSPDGSKIIFVQEFESGKNYRDELWTINVDGTNLRKIAILSEDPCEFWGSGLISPDNSYIVMTGECDIPPTYTVRKLVNLQEGNTNILPSGLGSIIWALNSKALAIVDQNTTPSRLALIDLNGKKLEEWTENKEDISMLINWSPDGKKLLILEGYPTDKSFSIIDFSDQKFKRQAEIQAEGYNIHSPVWYFE